MRSPVPFAGGATGWPGRGCDAFGRPGPPDQRHPGVQAAGRRAGARSIGCCAANARIRHIGTTPVQVQDQVWQADSDSVRRGREYADQVPSFCYGHIPNSASLIPQRKPPAREYRSEAGPLAGRVGRRVASLWAWIAGVRDSSRAGEAAGPTLTARLCPGCGMPERAGQVRAPARCSRRPGAAAGQVRPPARCGRRPGAAAAEVRAPAQGAAAGQARAPAQRAGAGRCRAGGQWWAGGKQRLKTMNER
jgi:hypothetical protein